MLKLPPFRAAFVVMRVWEPVSKRAEKLQPPRPFSATVNPGALLEQTEFELLCMYLK